MRITIVAGCLTILHSITAAQTNSGVVTGAGGRPITVIDNINSMVIPTIKLSNVEGTPYFIDEWKKGDVFFKKGKRADSLSLLFNAETNQLYFKWDSLTLTFMEEVLAFRIRYAEKSEIKEAYFKSGYPVNGIYTPTTFYQVLAEGPAVQLLCLRSKKINEQYVYGGNAKKVYTAVDEWYVYEMTSGQLEKIKINKSSVEKKLPSLAARIDELCKKNSWQVKTAAEMIQLINALNDQAVKM